MMTSIAIWPSACHPHNEKSGTCAATACAFLLLCMIAILICPEVMADARQRKVRNILVLHSYHQGFQWTDSISSGIQSEFETFKDDIKIHFEYLDTKRNPGETYFNHLVKFERFKTKLADIDFEVIISSDNNALRFIVEHGDELYPDIPVVFCGVNNYHPRLLKGKTHITGVVEYIDYAATLDLMRTFHPDRTHVVVILDKTPSGNAVKTEFEKIASDYADHFEFEYYQDFILEEVPEKISSLDRNDIIYMMPFNRDRNGVFTSYVDSIRMVSSASNVPIYGSQEYYFGNGIVGGMITLGFAQGQQAARLAKKVLAGTPAGNIPVITRSPNRYMFDYVLMSRFGLTIDQLPPGSQVINRPPGLYDQIKGVIVVSLAAVLAVALILGWRLVVERRNQVRLQQINTELDRRVAAQTSKLEHKNAQLEQEISERRKVERDLIDKTKRLEKALAEVTTLSGLLPICSSCKKIRDDKGYWNQIETYIHRHSDATFSHGICPECAKQLYPDFRPKH